MLDRPQSGSSLSENSSSANGQRGVSSRLEQFEKRQNELWWLTFIVLLLLGVAYVLTSWDSIRTFWHRAEAAAIAGGLVALIILFAAYMWNKTKEISELRGLMHGIEQRDAAPPNEKQLDQLFQIIASSQQGYRDLIDSFQDLLLAMTLDGEIRAVNRSFADLVGVSFQQIIGRPITDFVEEGSGSGAEMFQKALPRFLERRHWTGVVQIRLKHEKAIFYFDCVAHAMLRGDTVQGITILARDVTNLRRNEARFTELFESLQEGIYITTPEGVIVDANPALVRMLGYDSKEELLAKSVPEVFPNAEDRKVLKQEVDRQITVEAREITLLRKDGRSVICLNTSAVVRDLSGRVIRYQGALMDVTERREMEHKLYRQQEFARRLVDSFPDIILVLNAAAHYTYISPRCKEVLGYDPEEALSQELGGYTHSEDLPGLRALFADIIAGRQTFPSIEVRVRHKQGDWRRIRFNLSPLSDEAGKIEGVVMSGRDVTELKRLEEQLLQAEKLAAMGQMLAGVAHELNNPLTAILGVTELLREKKDIEESTRRQLDLTHRQARRAARIVQNLLEFSRPASPQKKAIDLNSVIDRTLQLHENSLRRNNVEVDFHPQEGLPGVIADANQLIQVFLNLISNAEQAIREVRNSGRIQIRASHVGGRIAVTVQDDGVGLNPETLPRIFDPFFTTKRPGGGTGLGLSICISIIREHGGTIEADALPAGGSAFTVFLPAATPGLPATRVKGPDSSSGEWIRPAATPTMKGRSVLVVDDEESIRMLLEEGLIGHDLHVDCAATAEQALAFVLGRSYDVLLCDLKLAGTGPNANGLQVAQRIVLAAGSSKPSVILMTGDLVDSQEVEGHSGEARRLQKPFRVSDVVNLLREIFAASADEIYKR
jgi:PAS domain S-box-containing protein